MTKRYFYDKIGNRIRVYDEAGNYSKSFYDSKNRIIKKEYYNNNLTKEITLNYTYDIFGNVERIEREDPNAKAQVAQYAYDALGRKIDAVWCMQAGCLSLPGQDYYYDGVGNRVRELGILFTYDKVGRLITADLKSKGIITYYYDGVGNRTRVDAPNGTTRNVYEDGNYLTKSIDPQGYLTEYSYDEVGNRIRVKMERWVAYEDISFSYDELNRITKKGWVTYSYDEVGNRIRVNGRRYFYDDRNLLEEEPDINDENAPQIEHYYDSRGNRVKTKGNRRLNSTYDNIYTFYNYDAEGKLTLAKASDYNWDIKDFDKIQGPKVFYE